LKEIDLHYNRIKEMPHELGPLKKLKSLNIRSNPFPQPEKTRVINKLQRSKANPGGISLTI
jgi:Leucine-rich repeat (LRR) protein